MKITKIILIISVVICTTLAKTEIYAQEKSNLNLEISKTFSEWTFFKNYNGIVDIGISYYYKIDKFYLGISLNTNFLKINPATIENEVNSTIIKPGINLTYPINLIDRINFEPKIRVGYAMININNKKYDYNKNQYGIYSSFELKLNYKTKGRIDYYFLINYDYTYLNKDKDFTQLDYYRNIHFINLGIGAKLKFYEKDEK